MKICMDYQPAVTRRAGIGRYAGMLARELPGVLSPEDSLCLFYFDFRRRAVVDSECAAHVRTCRCVPGGVMRNYWKFFGRPAFDDFSGDADVFHFTNFIVYPVKRGGVVSTIHDMSFMRFPQFTESKNLRNLLRGISKTVERSDAIITDSEFGARELTEFFPSAADRTHAIPLGISQSFNRVSENRIAEFRVKYGLERPFMLVVGTLEPRKNHLFLVKLLSELERDGLDLTVIGNRGWKYEETVKSFSQWIASGRLHWLERVDDGDLAPAYSAAQVFVLPSFYEGFGFPPLEAMACGTPVVASDGGSLGEILGDGACVLHGFDTDEWTATVRRVLTDSEFRAGLVARGKTKAAQYQWKNTVARTLEVYRSVAK